MDSRAAIRDRAEASRAAGQRFAADRRWLCGALAALGLSEAVGGARAFAQATKPAPAAKPVPKPVPPKLEHVQKTHAESLLGQPVFDARRQTIGHIVDVLIDTEGKPHAAVIEFTGFLGVGARKIAVAWKALHFSLRKDHIVIRVAMDPAALRAMPAYDVNAKRVPVAAPARSASPKSPPAKSP